MTRRIDKAILLAAGLGTRLRPLTLRTPKPLLVLDGTTLIDHQLRYLKNFGISEVAINIHHLGNMIMNHVGDGSRYGLVVHFSDEPTILGTGGGIRKAATLLEGDTLFVLNSDALIDVDLDKLAIQHVERGFAATIVVKRMPDGSAYTPVDIRSDRTLKGFGSGEHLYTGLQIVGPEFLKALPAAGSKSCLIKNGYDKLLRTGKKVGAFIYSGYWNDLGTPERYMQARQDVVSGRFRIFTE